MGWRGGACMTAYGACMTASNRGASNRGANADGANADGASAELERAPTDKRASGRGVNDAEGRASCSRASGGRASGGRGYVEIESTCRRTYPHDCSVTFSCGSSTPRRSLDTSEPHNSEETRGGVTCHREPGNCQSRPEGVSSSCLHRMRWLDVLGPIG